MRDDGGEVRRGDQSLGNGGGWLQSARGPTRSSRGRRSSPCGTQDGPWEFSSRRVDGARRRCVGDPRKKTRLGQRSMVLGVLRLDVEA